MKSEPRDELDRILDGALSAYSTAEPLDGLEQRVLNRIGGVKAPRRRFGFWGFALAASAVLLIGIAVLETRSHPAPNVAGSAAPAKHATETRVAAPVRPAVRRTRHVTRKRGRPEQMVFPTPTPLTTEERALVAFVEQHPKEALVAFTDAPKRDIEPISIEPIQIPPLPDLALEPQDGGQ